MPVSRTRNASLVLMSSLARSGTRTALHRQTSSRRDCTRTPLVQDSKGGDRVSLKLGLGALREVLRGPGTPVHSLAVFKVWPNQSAK